MTEDYSRSFGSQFPSELIALGTHKDVDDSVAALINKYYSYVESGDMDSAARIYEANKAALDAYAITADTIHYLEEEIYNIGLAALAKTNLIQSEDEPVFSQEGAYWIQEYDYGGTDHDRIRYSIFTPKRSAPGRYRPGGTAQKLNRKKSIQRRL